MCRGQKRPRQARHPHHSLLKQTNTDTPSHGHFFHCRLHASSRSLKKRAMAIDGGTIHVIVTSAFCFILISFRCGYRLLSNCRIHTSCHRTWHQDDVWMGLAIFPLTARAVCVGLYDNLTAKTNITPAEAVVAMKLLIPARIFYCLVYVHDFRLDQHFHLWVLMMIQRMVLQDVHRHVLLQTRQWIDLHAGRLEAYVLGYHIDFLGRCPCDFTRMPPTVIVRMLFRARKTRT